MAAERAWWGTATAVVAGGLVSRVAMLDEPAGALDSDEAIVGLMAQAFRDGDWTAFFWSQHYGGSLEAGLVAVVFAVVGPSVVAMKVVPMALSAAASIVTWRIGTRFLDRRLAVGAGCCSGPRPG